MILAYASYVLQETANAAHESATVEEWIAVSVRWLRLGVETMGAIVIALGVVVAIYQFVLALRRHEQYNRIRLTLARYLVLALEFQLAADILSTAIAPGWEQIGKLGAIAVIRTGLNYFLMREINETRPEPAASLPPTQTEERDAGVHGRATL